MNKKVIVGVVVAAVILLVGALIVLRMSSAPKAATHPMYGADENLPKLQASNIGFTVEQTDKQHVKIIVSKTDGIKHLASDVVYDAFARDENNQPTDQKVDREVSGDDVDLTPGQSYQSKDILLGSCSTGGKCVYDVGTTHITVTLSITKTDGKRYQSDYTLNVK